MISRGSGSGGGGFQLELEGFCFHGFPPCRGFSHSSCSVLATACTPLLKTSSVGSAASLVVLGCLFICLGFFGGEMLYYNSPSSHYFSVVQSTISLSVTERDRYKT